METGCRRRRPGVARGVGKLSGGRGVSFFYDVVFCLSISLCFVVFFRVCSFAVG